MRQSPCPPHALSDVPTTPSLSKPDDAGEVRLLPLALGTVIEETSDVRRFQAIKTAPKLIEVRLETSFGADREKVWNAIDRRLQEYLLAGAASVAVVRSPEAPRPDPKSGKYRQVWAEL